MTTISFIGNLTQDAEMKVTEEGRKYLLLQVAENIRKRDEKGDYLKDAQGHYLSSQTLYHSVFVNKGDAVLQALDLKKGHAIKVFGIAKFSTEKATNGYDQYVLKRIVAQYINTNPFDKDTDDVATDNDLDGIPFSA